MHRLTPPSIVPYPSPFRLSARIVRRVITRYARLPGSAAGGGPAARRNVETESRARAHTHTHTLHGGRAAAAGGGCLKHRDTDT